MTAPQTTDYQAAADYLAARAGEHSDVHELWWQRCDGEVRFWLFASPRDYRAEHALHGLHLALARKFPGLLFDLDIVDLKYLGRKQPMNVLAGFPLSFRAHARNLP